MIFSIAVLISTFVVVAESTTGVPIIIGPTENKITTYDTVYKTWGLITVSGTVELRKALVPVVVTIVKPCGEIVGQWEAQVFADRMFAVEVQITDRWNEFGDYKMIANYGDVVFTGDFEFLADELSVTHSSCITELLPTIPYPPGIPELSPSFNP